VKLELAIASTCTKTGCVVESLEGTLKEALYSSLVRDRIKVQPEQLVAINVDKNPPEIVWRWIRAAVIELDAAIVAVDDLQGHPAKVSLVSDLPLSLDIDEEVWACGTGQGFQIHDKIVDGKPAHPSRLLSYITPIIEEIYQR
jgi:hypothetical protein